MKKVLIISYYFPPFAGGAVTRVRKFVKYLARNNWQSIILTGDYRFQPGPKNESLLNEIPNSTIIYRIKSFLTDRSIVDITSDSILEQSIFLKIFIKLKDFIKIILYLPDKYIFWIIRVLFRAVKIIKEHKIDVVFSTSPPHSIQVLGLILKKLVKVKWVVDFRDDWASNEYFQTQNKLHDQFSFFLEELVVRNADKIILVTEESMNKVTSLYPHIEPDKWILITNGFDSEDLPDISFELKNKKNKEKKLLLTYTGTFPSYRAKNIKFFTALKQLKYKNRNIFDHLEFIFLGKFYPNEKDCPELKEIMDNIQIIGHQTPTQMYKYLFESDVLLLILSEGEGGDSAIPGKLYDYFAVRKPILAVIPNGAASNLIHRNEVGTCIDPLDVNEICENIVKLYTEKISGNLEKYNISNNIDKFDRKNLSQKLVKILNELI